MGLIEPSAAISGRNMAAGKVAVFGACQFFDSPSIFGRPPASVLRSADVVARLASSTVRRSAVSEDIWPRMPEVRCGLVYEATSTRMRISRRPKMRPGDVGRCSVQIPSTSRRHL